MNTPIYDFVRKYADAGVSRFHMPGHKGRGALGVEAYDITEIKGADTLYSADGIIAESEENATRLFDTAHTYYSAEGSPLAIKAMLATALVNAPDGTSRTLVAARNAHKSLIYAAAELDFDVAWLYPENEDHFCSCDINTSSLIEAIKAEKPFAVYVTSPDYLGKLADIAAISEVCRRLGVPLLVDNAHGAYLAFCDSSMHPMALGADMCADSAHKTLPVITGGAYLHISKMTSPEYVSTVRRMLSAFASTSPSYLVLSSLDACNAELADGYSRKIAECAEAVKGIKEKLGSLGFSPIDTEPLKIVFRANDFGYSGVMLAEHLRHFSIEVEFADGEYTVLMITPRNTDEDFSRLYTAFSSLERKDAIKQNFTALKSAPETRLAIKKAVFSKSELVDTPSAIGRVCAAPTAACPPAVPIVVSGEVIDKRISELLCDFGIDKIEVVKEG